MRRSSNEQTTSVHHIGFGDSIMDMLRSCNIPVTRENYLNLAYMGEPPEELSAEEEANLPPMLQRRDPVGQKLAPPSRSSGRRGSYLF